MGFFTDVMTVYNHFRDPETERDTWRRSIVKGVQWTHGKRQISVVNGIATESTIESITVDFEKEYVGRKPYLDPVEYTRLPEEEKADYWTLNPQTGLDYVLCGETDQEISKLSQIKGSYQSQGTIKSVSDNRNRARLKHIKVVAG